MSGGNVSGFVCTFDWREEFRFGISIYWGRSYLIGIGPLVFGWQSW